jgi:hypothetical protein
VALNINRQTIRALADNTFDICAHDSVIVSVLRLEMQAPAKIGGFLRTKMAAKDAKAGLDFE